jgi:hypothetical protein
MRKQIELATCGLRQIIVKLWKFLLTSVDLDVGSLGSTEKGNSLYITKYQGHLTFIIQHSIRNI